jgi:ATP-binding cassette, subfamily C (CFTR/MRP), member 1
MHTRTKVMDRLFGPDGLFRRWETTLILTSSSGLYLGFYGSTHLTRTETQLHHVDQLIVLNGNGELTTNPLGEVGHGRTGDQIQACQEDVDEIMSSESSTTVSPTPYSKVPAKEQDLSNKRQTGDFSSYRYFFASMSWRATVVFLIVQTGLAFLTSFPGKF